MTFLRKPYLSLTGLLIGLLIAIFISGCASRPLTKESSMYLDKDTVIPALKLRDVSDFHIMSVEEIVFESDVIAKVKVIRVIPVCFRLKGDVYNQLAVLKIEELLKGEIADETIEVYARNRNMPLDYIAAYEIYNDLVVFLREDDGYYFTLNNNYGQMPIHNKILFNWRKMEDNELKLKLVLPYKEAKSAIKEILIFENQFE